MKLLRNFVNPHLFKDGVVTAIGNFDGVHLGHKYLLDELRKQSIAKNLPMLVIIFEPQAREFLTPNDAPPRIAPLRDKLKLLSASGVEYVLCLHFNKKLANMSAAEFASKVIFANLNSKYLLVGRDFKFGKNRQGNFELLETLSSKFNCRVASCADYMFDKQKISSTLIRHYLVNGEFNQAKLLLGREYSLSGRVFKGDGQGRKWGVPTANLRISQRPLVLKGVYCVQIKLKTGTIYPFHLKILDFCYRLLKFPKFNNHSAKNTASSGKMVILAGVANIGCRPTVGGKRQVLEVHILNFSGSLYGKELEVVFLKKLRDEEKFSSIAALISKIKLDVALAKDFFLI